MDWFVGRKNELKRLEAICGRPGVKTCAVFGRRQVGKSTLLRAFADGKRSLIIQSLQHSAYENLAQMGMDISAFLGKDISGFGSFAEAFSCLRSICAQEKTLLIFDEYPYLVSAEPSVSSLLQRFIDIDLPGTETMMVICGSSISMMRNETESIDSPLYGRIHDRMEIRPMPLRDTAFFHKGMSDLDLIKTHMTVGGLPRYHRDMRYTTYRECVEKCFFSADAVLRDEAENIIRSEFSPFSVHSGIIWCISDGMVRQSEIAQKLGISRPVCKKYMDNMERLGIISARNPRLGAPKRPIYRISDEMVAFRYTVLRRHMTALEDIRMSDAKKYVMMEHDIDTHMGIRFEDICREYLTEEYDVLDMGSWWGRVDGTDTDIDIVATVMGEDMMEHTILAECKFRRRPVGFTELNTLTKRAEALSGYSNGHLMIFSISGFAPELKEFAEETGVALVGPDMILGDKPSHDLSSLGLFRHKERGPC